VGKHGTERHIADTLDALGGSVELVINDDSALLVGLDTDLLEAKSLGYWSSTDRNKNDVGFKLCPR
jgi:hypothetical protein